MNDPKSPPANGKSPFAHRATRTGFSVTSTPAPAPAATPSPVAGPAPAASPEPTPRKGAPVAWIAGGVAALVVVAGVAVSLSGNDKPEKSTPVADAPAKVLTPGERLAAAESRFAGALSLARRYECEKISPGDFSKVILKESDARAAKAARKPEAAAVACEAASRAAETLAAPAAQKAYAAALAAIRLSDFRDYAGDAWRAPEADAARGESALAKSDFRVAAESYDAAVTAFPGAVSAAKLRLDSLARAAVSRDDTAEARVFFRKLVLLDPANAFAADWLMRKGVRSGAALRSPKLGFALAYAAPGAFNEGSPDAEPGRDPDEVRRAVTLSKGFWMGVTDVTQGQWDAVMGKGAAAAKLAREKRNFVGDDLPMVDVTWREAVDFCRRLSAVEGAHFRLPTEAEWEFACRAGTDAPYSTGKDFLSPGEAVVDDGTSSAPNSPRPVTAGTAPVNPWGLRDMHGNIWQWCSDWSAPRTRDAATDPAGPDDRSAGRADTATKIVRGGSWNDPATAARSAKRWQYPPAVAVNYIGFRVLMDFDAGTLPE